MKTTLIALTLCLTLAQAVQATAIIDKSASIPASTLSAGSLNVIQGSGKTKGDAYADAMGKVPAGGIVRHTSYSGGGRTDYVCMLEVELP